MKRAFLLVECDDGWCVVPTSEPNTDSLDRLQATVTVSWTELRAYSRFSQAVFHLGNQLRPEASDGENERG